MRTEQIRPVGNQVLVRVENLEERSVGGIFLVGNQSQAALKVGGQQHRIGTVVAFGPGLGIGTGWDKATRQLSIRPTDTGIRIGSRIVFVDGFGAEIEVEEGTHRMILAGAIVAEIESAHVCCWHEDLDRSISNLSSPDQARVADGAVTVRCCDHDGSGCQARDVVESAKPSCRIREPRVTVLARTARPDRVPAMSAPTPNEGRLAGFDPSPGR